MSLNKYFASAPKCLIYSSAALAFFFFFSFSFLTSKNTYMVLYCYIWIGFFAFVGKSMQSPGQGKKKVFVPSLKQPHATAHRVHSEVGCLGHSNDPFHDPCSFIASL